MKTLLILILMATAVEAKIPRPDPPMKTIEVDILEYNLYAREGAEGYQMLFYRYMWDKKTQFDWPVPISYYYKKAKPYVDKEKSVMYVREEGFPYPTKVGKWWEVIICYRGTMIKIKARIVNHTRTHYDRETAAIDKIQKHTDIDVQLHREHDLRRVK